jgi:hypothetical protein
MLSTLRHRNRLDDGLQLIESTRGGGGCATIELEGSGNGMVVKRYGLRSCFRDILLAYRAVNISKKSFQTVKLAVKNRLPNLHNRRNLKNTSFRRHFKTLIGLQPSRIRREQLLIM